jgi:hypothetical protein
MQEAARKCVEQGFGQLVAQFEILKNPIQNWNMEDIQNLLYCCIILHNMVTAERHLTFVDGGVVGDEDEDEEEENGNGISLFGFQEQPFDQEVTTLLGHRVVHMLGNVEDGGEHDRLMADLEIHKIMRINHNIVPLEI